MLGNKMEWKQNEPLNTATETEFHVPEYNGREDFLRRIETQRKLVLRFIERKQGTVELWARRYAVIFGDLWDDKYSSESWDSAEKEPHRFRKLIFAEWQDTPEFFDRIQKTLDRFRKEKVIKKLDRRQERKTKKE